ncbi:MAG TPA: right-handed parallel beta-helix repeat-containing protein [Solirubrobacteraceae bacterium]
MLAAAVALVAAAPAGAHIERPSYWPLPQADCSIHPCAGGKVPAARSLQSAVKPPRSSHTRVVCQSDSLTRLKRSIASARRSGYYIRPTDHRSLSKQAAARLLAVNRALFARCRYHEIQPAVTASHNQDTVVIMPGLYTEPESRAKPTFDPSCKQYEITDNGGGDISGAVTYAYQFHCPNDQNLIAVLGRAVGSGQDPHPPLVDRHGIPNRGKCIRCNLQMLGSGVSADDVVIDAGRVASGNGPPSGSVKDVGIRADRADGFVLQNVTVRHAKEHDIYVLESGGYLLDRFKAYWAGEYGVLTFVEDHGLIQNCDAAGSGDSGLYPGAGAKTSAGRDIHYYPVFRYSQEIRDCDSRHNLAGYSGTDGSGTHIDHDNFYDNSLGFTTDVFTAPGHPGFPQQGDLIEYNNFYSNNFNPYVAGSDIAPSEPEPVGTGLWIAGGNDDVVRYNHFYDNWRRGAMLFAVPDATVCGPAPVGSSIPVPGCDPKKFSTSYNDRFYGNVMGVAPNGTVEPNGTDFWWDAYATNTGNCWYGNTAAPGRSVTTSPSGLPGCDGGAQPWTSTGTGDPQNEGELLSCFAAIEAGGGYNPATCPWFATPAKPQAAQDRPSRADRVAASWASSWYLPRRVCLLYLHQWSPACAGTAPRPST